MALILRAEPNASKEFEIIRVSFISKYQSPLIMVIKEYWYNGEVVHANVLWSTGDITRTIKRLFRKEKHDR